MTLFEKHRSVELNPHRGGSNPIPKETRFRFLGHFWHILEDLEPELLSKELYVKGIEKKSFFDSQFLISRTGRRNRDS